MPDGVRYRILRTTRELEDFVPEWAALWRNDPAATPFQSPEWLVPWWHWFQQPELKAVVIEGDSGPVGFLPFYIYCEPASRERRLLPLGVGTTDYLDGLFAPVCTGEHVGAALNLLFCENDWDLLCALQLRPGSLLLRTIEEMWRPGIRLFESEGCLRMPVLRMRELPGKLRGNVRYYRTRAMRLGSPDLSAAGEAELAETFDVFVRLHTQRWQSRGQSGVLADPRVLAWHREALPLLLRGGMLRLNALRLDDEIIAVVYALIDPPGRRDRCQYVYLPTHDEKHSDLSPGTLLLAYSMERAADEGVCWFDLLRGNESYKQMWHPQRASTMGFSMPREAASYAM